jgi:hypothetical protein
MKEKRNDEIIRITNLMGVDVEITRDELVSAVMDGKHTIHMLERQVEHTKNLVVEAVMCARHEIKGLKHRVDVLRHENKRLMRLVKVSRIALQRLR